MARRGPSSSALQIPMSAMIDVTFLLLIYFIITQREELPEAHLAINLPSPQPPASPVDERPNLLEIEVHPGQIILRKRPLASLAELELILRRLTEYDTHQTVLVKTSTRAPTRELVQVLDLCKGLGLNQLSVMTLK